MLDRQPFETPDPPTPAEEIIRDWDTDPRVKIAASISRGLLEIGMRRLMHQHNQLNAVRRKHRQDELGRDSIDQIYDTARLAITAVAGTGLFRRRVLDPIIRPDYPVTAVLVRTLPILFESLALPTPISPQEERWLADAGKRLARHVHVALMGLETCLSEYAPDTTLAQALGGLFDQWSTSDPSEQIFRDEMFYSFRIAFAGYVSDVTLPDAWGEVAGFFWDVWSDLLRSATEQIAAVDIPDAVEWFVRHGLRCDVAGIHHGRCADDLGGLQVGDVLELVAEPQNEHDHWAVRILHLARPLGYVPRTHNKPVARLLHNNRTLLCVVTAVDLEVQRVAIEIRAVQSPKECL